MTRRAQPSEPAEGRLTAAELADYLARYVRPDAQVRIRHGGQIDPATGLVADSTSPSCKPPKCPTLTTRPRSSSSSKASE
jgi:hypothetical protein